MRRIGETWQRLVRRFGMALASLDLVLPPGLRWVDRDALDDEVVKGLVLGMRYDSQRCLVLFARPGPMAARAARCMRLVMEFEAAGPVHRGQLVAMGVDGKIHGVRPWWVA